MVRAVVALFHAPVDLFQILVDLVQAHSPQGWLLSVVSWLVVVGPNLGLIGSVGFCEGGGDETGCVWVRGRFGCIQVATLALMLHLGCNIGG